MNLRIKKKIRKNFFLLIKKIGPNERLNLRNLKDWNWF